MADVATIIIQTRERLGRTLPLRRRPTHIYRGSLDNMRTWIDVFLQKMRENFPHVHISGRVDGEAEARRYDWGSEMGNYNTVDAGVLFLSEGIIDNMIYARQQNQRTAESTYPLFKFQMVISVAHEIVHFLTGFITGTATPDTPPGVTARPYGRDDVGEAGRWWEDALLGGFVEFWSYPSDPLGSRQAGLPYLFVSGSRSDAAGQRVSMSYIQEFLDGGEHLTYLTQPANL